MHHKRRRPKHQRAGCLFCKPWKDERGAKADGRRPGRRGLRKELTKEEAVGTAQRPPPPGGGKPTVRGRDALHRPRVTNEEVDRQLGFPEVR